MDFLTFEAHVRKLSDLIMDAPFAPDAIIAISKGGWLPARLMSKHLGVQKLFSYGISYTDPARTVIGVHQTVKLTADIKRVLVVEDYLQTGRAIKHAVGALMSQASDVRSACIGLTAKTSYAPTYTLGRVTEIPQLPWD